MVLKMYLTFARRVGLSCVAHCEHSMSLMSSSHPPFVASTDHDSAGPFESDYCADADAVLPSSESEQVSATLVDAHAVGLPALVSPHSLMSLCYDGDVGEIDETPAPPWTADGNARDLRRRMTFWRERFDYASSFAPRVLQCLHDQGVDSLPQARFLVDDALSGVMFYPPSSQLFVPSAGRCGGVFVHMTTERLLNATSILAFDEGPLRAEVEAIRRSQNLAILMVLVELCDMLQQSTTCPSLHANDVALLAPSVRFIVAVLTAEPHGNTRRKLSFTIGSHLATSESPVSLQVAFEPTPELAHLVGYAEFSQLVASGVRNCRASDQWASQGPFYSADAIVRMASERRRNAPKRMRSAD